MEWYCSNHLVVSCLAGATAMLSALFDVRTKSYASDIGNCLDIRFDRSLRCFFVTCFASLALLRPFIKRLYIQPDGMCIDALGQQRRLEYDANGEVLLLKGRLWVSGDTLFREGRSGIVMRFDRAPEHPLFANDDEEEEEEEEEELAEEDQETDNLHILENMVSGVASHRSDLRNFLR
eukprot:s4075_g3.t1